MPTLFVSVMPNESLMFITWQIKPFPAVKVMKTPRLHRGLFDLQCRHMSYAPRHQSLLRPKELQLTSDPSPWLPLSKRLPLSLGDWQLSRKSQRSSGSQISVMWRAEEVVNWAGLAWKVLIVPPSSLQGSSFMAPHLKYLHTNKCHCHMFIHLLICFWLESSCSWLKRPLSAALQSLASSPNPFHPTCAGTHKFLILSPL